MTGDVIGYVPDYVVRAIRDCAPDVTKGDWIDIEALIDRVRDEHPEIGEKELATALESLVSFANSEDN